VQILVIQMLPDVCPQNSICAISEIRITILQLEVISYKICFGFSSSEACARNPFKAMEFRVSSPLKKGLDMLIRVLTACYSAARQMVCARVCGTPHLPPWNRAGSQSGRLHRIQGRRIAKVTLFYISKDHPDKYLSWTLPNSGKKLAKADCT